MKSTSLCHAPKQVACYEVVFSHNFQKVAFFTWSIMLTSAVKKLILIHNIMMNLNYLSDCWNAKHRYSKKSAYLENTARVSSISCSNLDALHRSVLPVLEVTPKLFGLESSGIKKLSQWWGLPMLMKVFNIWITLSWSTVVLKKSFSCFLQIRSSELNIKIIQARYIAFRYTCGRGGYNKE